MSIQRRVGNVFLSTLESLYHYYNDRLEKEIANNGQLGVSDEKYVCMIENTYSQLIGFFSYALVKASNMEFD